VRLKFGWGAQQSSQLDKFLRVEYGSVSLTDPSGHLVFSDAWDKSDTSGWSAYVATQLTRNGTSFIDGLSTSRVKLFGALSNPNPGTDAVYNLTMDWELGSAVNDGLDAYLKGLIVQTTNRPIIVHNFNAP